MPSEKVKTSLMFLPVAAIITGLYLFNSLWIAIALYFSIIIFSLILFHESSFPQKIFMGKNFRLTVLLSFLTASNGFLVYYLWPILEKPGMPLADILVKLGLTEQLWIILILCYCLLTPVLEEYFWRELMGSQKKTPDLSDFMYAGYHVPTLLIFVKPVFALIIFFVLTAAACIWRNIRNSQNGLFVPVVSHFIADVSTIFAIYLSSNNMIINHRVAVKNILYFNF